MIYNDRLNELKRMRLERFLPALGYKTNKEKRSRQHPVYENDTHRIVLLPLANSQGFWQWCSLGGGRAQTCYDLVKQHLGGNPDFKEVMQLLESTAGQLTGGTAIVGFTPPPVDYPPLEECNMLAIKYWKTLRTISTPENSCLCGIRGLSPSIIKLYSSEWFKYDTTSMYVLTRLEGSFCSVYTHYNTWIDGKPKGRGRCQQGVPRGLAILRPKGKDKPQHFVICESVIDALAYYQIKGDRKSPPYLISTCGQITARQLSYLNNIAETNCDALFTLAFDSDASGRRYAERVRELLTGKVKQMEERWPPTGSKDWAQELQNCRSKKLEKLLKDDPQVKDAVPLATPPYGGEMPA